MSPSFVFLRAVDACAVSAAAELGARPPTRGHALPAGRCAAFRFAKRVFLGGTSDFVLRTGCFRGAHSISFRETGVSGAISPISFREKTVSRMSPVAVPRSSRRDVCAEHTAAGDKREALRVTRRHRPDAAASLLDPDPRAAYADLEHLR